MENVIEIKDLTKWYKNVMGMKFFKAVDNLSFEVKRGEIFGLLGPNGSGKTTLLKLLLGLIFPSGGSVHVLGKSPRFVRTKMKIGYLPEHPYFYDFLTPVELLRFYGSLFHIDSHIVNRRADALLEKVGLKAFRKMKVRNFSKGMLQRIGLAISLINDPELLFLDEPTLGLDPIGTNEIQALLRQLNSEGKTIFLASHLLAQVQGSCHRVAIIYRGKLLKCGKLDDLLTIRDEMDVIIRKKDESLEGKLKEFIRLSGSEVISIANRKDSLKDLFIRIINEEKGT